jgi:hypothetical protein
MAGVNCPNSRKLWTYTNKKAVNSADEAETNSFSFEIVVRAMQKIHGYFYDFFMRIKLRSPVTHFKTHGQKMPGWTPTTWVRFNDQREAI